MVLEAPVESSDPGWIARTQELRADMEALAETLAAAEPPVAMPPMPSIAINHGRACFSMIPVSVC